MPNWYVYLAECVDGSLYTGVTTNLENRMKQHNTGYGSAYVRSKGGASLVYAELATSRSAAQATLCRQSAIRPASFLANTTMDSGQDVVIV